MQHPFVRCLFFVNGKPFGVSWRGVSLDRLFASKREAKPFISRHADIESASRLDQVGRGDPACLFHPPRRTFRKGFHFVEPALGVCAPECMGGRESSTESFWQLASTATLNLWMKLSSCFDES